MEFGTNFHFSGVSIQKLNPSWLSYLKGIVRKLQSGTSFPSGRGVCTCTGNLDSRYQHFKYFSMEDVIADNSSSSILSGGWSWDSAISSGNVLHANVVNDQLAQGNSQDISGDPVVSVIQLCQLLAERQRPLPEDLHCPGRGRCTGAARLKLGDADPTRSSPFAQREVASGHEFSLYNRQSCQAGRRHSITQTS